MVLQGYLWIRYQWFFMGCPNQDMGWPMCESHDTIIFTLTWVENTTLSFPTQAWGSRCWTNPSMSFWETLHRFRIEPVCSRFGLSVKRFTITPLQYSTDVARPVRSRPWLRRRSWRCRRARLQETRRQREVLLLREGPRSSRKLNTHDFHRTQINLWFCFCWCFRFPTTADTVNTSDFHRTQLNLYFGHLNFYIIEDQRADIITYSLRTSTSIFQNGFCSTVFLNLSVIMIVRECSW
jgi:hypothetical protein